MTIVLKIKINFVKQTIFVYATMSVNKIQISVSADDRHKDSVNKELIAADNWNANWSWMVGEYV